MNATEQPMTSQQIHDFLRLAGVPADRIEWAALVVIEDRIKASEWVLEGNAIIKD